MLYDCSTAAAYLDESLIPYICPEKRRLTWKATTREGYRQYCCEGKTCKGCPRRGECFGARMSQKVVERHVWQGSLERVDAFAKTHRGKRIYSWRKETIERSFAEAKENRGLLYARMLRVRNMREQCFLTAASQNIKRLAASFRRTLPAFYPCAWIKTQGFVRGLRRRGYISRRLLSDRICILSREVLVWRTRPPRSLSTARRLT